MILSHVKWFIENAPEVAPYEFGEPIVWIWMAAGLALVSLAFVLEQFVPNPPKKFTRWAKKYRPIWIYVFQVTLALSLLFAAWNKVVLVPHYAAENWSFSIVQSLIALLLLSNKKVDLAALLLFVSYLFAGMQYGALEVLDYVNILGMVSFLGLLHSPMKKLKPYRKWALPSLRVLTGIALIVLAFSEKLAAPEKAVALLETYNMNFMEFFGMSARTFILSAGSMEAIFGLIMISGWITRINVISLAVFLLASNVYFLVQGHGSEALIELMGHLPIIGTAILLIIYGHTFKNAAPRKK